MGSAGHLNTKLKEAKKTEAPIDYLVLGSSHAYRSFDGRNFERYGLSGINMGSSRQSHMVTGVLLKRYLDDLQPKLVIYEVYPNIFNGDGVESALDIIANDRNDALTAKLTLDQNHLKVYNTFIYGAYRDVFDLNKNFVEPLIKGEDQYITGGFVAKEMRYFKGVEVTPSTVRLTDSQLAAFEENISILKERNINYVLVQAPFVKVLYNSFRNNKKLDSTLASYGTYYNYNERMQLNDTLHFYDANHLNQSGVNLFNEAFYREVLQPYFQR